jgi:DNA-binding MarR family transcriptional regulator
MNTKNLSKTNSRSGGIRLDLNKRLAYRFLHLAGQQMRCLAEMYGPRYRLTIAKWKVLSVIGFFAPLSSTEVGRHTSLEPDKVSRTTDQLVRAGLVVREQDPRDRRRVILTLSAKGKRVNDTIEEVRCAIEVELLNVLTPPELDAFYGMLDKLDERAAAIFSESPAWESIMARAQAGARTPRKPNRAKRVAA